MGDADFQPHFVNIVAVASAADLAHWERELGRPIADDEVEPGNATFAHIGRQLSGPEYLASVEWMHGFQRRMAAWWAEGHDVLLTPVLNGPPPPLGWLSDPEQGLDRVIGLLQYTAQFNVTGQPAVSLPLHWTDSGLPVGLQFVAPYGREDVLVRLAAQLEEAAPWRDRRPPVNAGSTP
jgi:amidase